MVAAVGSEEFDTESSEELLSVKPEQATEIQ
jgi:hypothetical protein